MEGNVYEGDVKDGRRHGRGTYRYLNGDSYQGQFFDNMRHGRVDSCFIKSIFTETYSLIWTFL